MWGGGLVPKFTFPLLSSLPLIPDIYIKKNNSLSPLGKKTPLPLPAGGNGKPVFFKEMESFGGEEEGF